MNIAIIILILLILLERALPDLGRRRQLNNQIMDNTAVKTAKCKCGNTFTPQYRNGIKISAKCEDCRKAARNPRTPIKRKFINDHPLTPNEAFKTPKKKLGKKKIGKTELQNARDRADHWFSLYIRLIGADYKGMVTCFTCGAPLHYKAAECGHFNKRRYVITRYFCPNANVQCVECNHGDDSGVYREKMVANFGDAFVEELEAMKNKYQDGTLEFYNEMSDKFRELVNQLPKPCE